MTGTIILILLTVSFLAVALPLQKRTYFIQYTYFLRVPIFIGLALLVFPFLAITTLSGITRNWFELDFLGLLIVTWFSIFLAWAVMYQLFMLFLLIPKRNRLTWSRTDYEKAQLGKSPYENTIPEPLRNIWIRLPLFGLLAVPMILISSIQSQQDDLTKFAAVFLGILAAISLRYLVYLIRTRFGAFSNRLSRLRWLVSWLPKRVKFLSGVNKLGNLFVLPIRVMLGAEGIAACKQGFEEPKDGVFLIQRAQAFFWLTLVIYLIGFFVLNPALDLTIQNWMPALAYILLLMTLIVWILPVLTFIFDKFRIPVVAVIVVASTILYQVTGADHYYELNNVQCGESDSGSPTTFGPVKAYQSWAATRPIEDYPTIVMVSASGGGIKASLWTTVVLSELQRSVGPEFAHSILLISATSGGAVGAMYYVDGFENGKTPSDLDSIVRASGISSLGAVAWGLIYPDFWRTLSAVSMTKDRAWAQERRWETGLRDSGATLASWRQDIKKGLKPILAFNVTISETGEQLVISPLSSMPGREWRAHTLDSIYPSSDMKVVTAARLSATFPYVTPISRPRLPAKCGSPAYHIADGGYYDNYGVVAIVDFLRSILSSTERNSALIVQIRASESDIGASSVGNSSISYETIGPLGTMLNVRDASQIVRNDVEIDMLTELWRSKGKSICSIVFELDNDSPLSWHLSEEERSDIEKYMATDDNQQALSRVKSFLRNDSMSCRSE